MQSSTYVVYFNQEKAPSATHEVINQEIMNLCKAVTNLEEGMWEEHKMNEVCPLIKEWKTKRLYLCKYVFI